MLRNACSKRCGSFSDIGQATWPFERTDDIIGARGCETLDVERFSYLWVTKSCSWCVKLNSGQLHLYFLCVLNT